jgi:hypothetical protein
MPALRGTCIETQFADDVRAMRRSFWLGIGIVAALSQALDAAQSPPATTPASAPTSEPVHLFDKAMAQRADAITALRIDPAFQREVRQRRRMVQARLSAESDVENRIMLALSWANWELAEAVAPAATRWLMGYRTRYDLRQFERTAAFANRALDVAKQALGSLGESRNSAVARRRDRWGETLGTLRLFAAAYNALSRAAALSDTKPASIDDTCREAALGLAELRENEDPDTAAAARLWQAALLEVGSRPRRDLAVLDLAMVPPERLPYDFFSRILRCQILMDNGSYALVAGLILRMEDRCDQWFNNDSKNALRAKLTLIAVRINCLWQWAEALRATDPVEATRLQERADALAAKNFPAGETTRIYRLDRAIPVFMQVPPLTEKAGATQEKPAPSSGTVTSAPTSEPRRAPTSETTPGGTSE